MSIPSKGAHCSRTVPVDACGRLWTPVDACGRLWTWWLMINIACCSWLVHVYHWIHDFSTECQSRSWKNPWRHSDDVCLVSAMLLSLDWVTKAGGDMYATWSQTHYRACPGVMELATLGSVESFHLWLPVFEHGCIDRNFHLILKW